MMEEKEAENLHHYCSLQRDPENLPKRPPVYPERTSLR